jgi:hypothetical protein
MLFHETNKLLVSLFLLLLLTCGNAVAVSEHQPGSVVGSMLFVNESEKTTLGSAAKVIVELQHEGQTLTIVSDDNGDFIVKLPKGIYLLKSARSADNKPLRFSSSQHRCLKVEPNKDTRFDVMLLMP